MNKMNNAAEPHLEKQGVEFQDFGSVVPMPNGLSTETCKKSVKTLNSILADTITLRDLYKKHHWQVAGRNFQQLHLLFDSHYKAQSDLVDAIAERVQLLGGVSVAMAPDVAKMASIEAPPSGREPAGAQLSRLLNAHEVVLKAAHKGADQASDSGDHGTNDLLASSVIPTNELQVWFLSQHLVEAGNPEEAEPSSKKSARSAA